LAGRGRDDGVTSDFGGLLAQLASKQARVITMTDLFILDAH
jgi:hypothetical protein